MPFFFLSRYSSLGFALLLGGCSLLPHKAAPNRPLEEAAASLAENVVILPESSGNQSAEAIETEFLNQLIISDRLDDLIKEALSANPNLQKARLTLRVRQTEKKQIDGGHLPAVEAAFATSKEKDQDVSYTGSINVSWEADLWNKLSDESAAASEKVGQQQALLQSAHDVLAAEVMKSWLGLIAQQHAINIQQQRLEVLENNERFITQRYRNGIGSSDDLSSARSTTATERSSLAQDQESLAQQQRSLQTLLGRTIRHTVEIEEDYPHVVLPLTDLPAQTLGRRPDLQAAYLAIKVANLNSAVAYKELLPSISLKAALKDIADSPRAALLTNPIWSLLGQLTAPLYQGGQLRASAEIAELEAESTYQSYRETLLIAVTEFENTLGLERSLRHRQQHIEQALTYARDSLSKYQHRYRSGLSTIMELLNVEKNTYDLEGQLDNIIYQRLINRIDLGLALGLGVTE